MLLRASSGGIVFVLSPREAHEVRRNFHDNRRLD